MPVNPSVYFLRTISTGLSSSPIGQICFYIFLNSCPAFLGKKHPHTLCKIKITQGNKITLNDGGGGGGRAGGVERPSGEADFHLSAAEAVAFRLAI